MPKIDVLTARGRTGTIEAQASPDSFGSQMGEGLQRFGQALESVSDKLQQQKDDIDLADRATYYEQQAAEHYQKVLNDDTLLGDTVQDTMRLRSNAMKKFARAQVDGLGMTQTRDTQDETGAPMQTQLPPASKAVQLAMQKYIVGHAGQATINLQADVLKREAARQENDLTRSVNTYADLAARDPSNEAINLDKMQTFLERARANGVVPAEVLDKQEATAFDRFWKQKAIQSPDRVKGLIQEIRTGTMDPDRNHIDQSKLHEYEGLANQAIAGKTSEEERQRRLLEAQARQEQEVTRQQFVKKWTDNSLTTEEILLSNLPAQGDGSKEHYIQLMIARAKELNKGKGDAQDQEATRQAFVEKSFSDTLTPKEVLASNLEAVGQGSKEHFLNEIERKAKEKAKTKESKEERFVKDPRLFATMLSQIRTGDIKSEQDLETRYTSSINKNRGIDFDDLKELRKEFDEMRTPDGRTLLSSKDKVLQGMKPSIDKSVLDKLDPEGSAAFLEYQQFVSSEVNRYRKEGKDPYRLFDSNNTDEYVGRPAVVSRYQRSLRETIRDQVNRFKRPDRGASGALPPEKQRKAGETAEEWLRRTR